MAPPPQVRVGVGVFILKSTQEDPQNPTFLMGKRKGSHGSGTWALPGGHLEFDETIEHCAARETLEETGLEVSQVRFLTATDNRMPEENKHYVTMFMICTRADSNAEPQNLEPEKCDVWEWVTWAELATSVQRQGESSGAGVGDHDTQQRRFFSPIVDLIRQRPGVLPSI